MMRMFSFLLATVPVAAFAQAADAADVPPQSPFMSLLPFVAILAVMYFIMIKPQQKRMKAHQAALSALKKGDDVVTGGGIVGKITKIGDADTITVEIAKGVEVTVMKSTVSGLVGAPAPVVVEKKKAANNKNDNSVVSRSSIANDN